MNVEQAFLAGFHAVQKQLPEARGSDVSVLAAHRVFCNACKGKEYDERFNTDAPLYAQKLILRAYASELFSAISPDDDED